MDGMNIGDWFSVGASLAAVLGVIIALSRMAKGRREGEVARGAREEKDRQDHAKIEAIEVRVRALEDNSQTVEITLVEIKTILQRVVVDVASLSAKLDGMRQ